MSKINVATLNAHVATLQRRSKPTSRRLDVATSRRGKPSSRRYREGSKCIFSNLCLRYETLPSCTVTLGTFVMFCINRSSPVPAFESPESKQQKRDTNHGQNSNPTQLKQIIKIETIERKIARRTWVASQEALCLMSLARRP